MLTFMGPMKRVVNAFVRERNRRLGQYNLTSAQVDVLILLLRTPENTPVYPVTMQNRLGLSCPTVNGLLTRLEHKGFIRLETAAGDRRHKQILLTDLGREIDSILQPLGTEWEQHATFNFSDAELLVLGQLMHKLEANIRRPANQDNSPC